MQKPELISPAGDLKKLKIAFMYGADAVYASTPQFSMRTRDIGFNYDSLKEGIDYAHKIGKKVYITLNIYPHPVEIENLKVHAQKVIDLKPDAIIVADPGIIEFIRSRSDIPLHLSTQANATNQLSIDFWAKQGIERVVLARELSLNEIKIVSKSLSRSYCRAYRSTELAEVRQAGSSSISGLGLEAFVHGSMCMAYSGRCQLSNYLTGRDPNRGMCAQACRFNYRLKEFALEEEMRPGEEFPIIEDDRGTYILNSKDLCMVEYIPELIDAGVSSFKIEGRIKSPYYVACVTSAYRRAIDSFFDNPNHYNKDKILFKRELLKVSNRKYTTGFYFNKPSFETNNYESSKPKSSWGFIGVVKDYDNKRKVMIVETKNYLQSGTQGEIITPEGVFKTKFRKLIKDGHEIAVAHANNLIDIPYEKSVPRDTFLRIKI